MGKYELRSDSLARNLGEDAPYNSFAYPLSSPRSDLPIVGLYRYRGVYISHRDCDPFGERYALAHRKVAHLQDQDCDRF